MIIVVVFGKGEFVKGFELFGGILFLIFFVFVFCFSCLIDEEVDGEMF